MSWFTDKTPSAEQRTAATGTTLIHAGEQSTVHGEVMPSICLSTTFRQTSPGVPVGEYDYTRAGNPTRRAFEEAIAASEGGKYGFAYSSGMAAMTTVLCMLKHGDYVIAIDDVYGGVDRLLRQVAVPQWGLQYKQCGMEDMAELERLVPGEGRCMVWLETPTNPTLKVVDVKQVVSVVKRVNRQCLVIVDNTFATPCLQNPLLYGADLVLHSVTKYIGGHSDVLMGAVITNDDFLADRLQFLQKAIGAVPSPFDCFMALRGLKTLHVRIRQHCESAMKVAVYLSRHKHVDLVHYPGLPTHKNHQLARQQMVNGFGGIVSFLLKPPANQPKGTTANMLPIAVKFSTSLKVITLAESLGGVESLVDVPSVMTHAAVPAEQRQRLGISDALMRLSVGLEGADDLIADLDNALAAAYTPDPLCL